MNAARFTATLFLMLTLAACSADMVGYSPEGCSESCDAAYRECLRSRPDDPARDAQCLQQRERCLGQCLTLPCDGLACEPPGGPTRSRECAASCDAAHRECLRGRPDDQTLRTYCTQQHDNCLELCEDDR